MKDLERDGRLLTALLDAMPDAVLVSDGNGTITRANHATGRLFGYDPAELIGDSVGTLMPQAMADRGDGFMQSHRETGQERRVEGMRRNGETFALNLSVGHASYEGEDHFVAILHGLGASATAQEALARTARLDAIGQMTTGISHDFSNLLTVIMGNLELLEKKLHDPEEQAMLADAQEAAAMGAELTAGLSAFARNTAGKFDAISVNATCETALTLIGRTFDPQYEISLTLADDLPAVMADTTKLQSALINIALNARDAMPEGGKVMIRTEVVTIDDDYIAQELDVSEGVYVRISITHTHGLAWGRTRNSASLSPISPPSPWDTARGLGLRWFTALCGNAAVM